MTFRAEGHRASHHFRLEPGGHRWQRVPPNDKRGRVHTSTVTVAVMREPTPQELRLDERDLEWKATRGSGAGGQHRNKVASAVQLFHKPSGLMVRCEAERSQHQNRLRAEGLLRARLAQLATSQATDRENATRRAQVGSGMRGDKVRTIRVPNSIVTQHPTGRQIPLKEFLRGELNRLA